MRICSSKTFLGSLPLAIKGRKQEGKGQEGRQAGERNTGKDGGELAPKRKNLTPPTPTSICNFTNFPRGYNLYPLKREKEGARGELSPLNIFPKSAPLGIDYTHTRTHMYSLHTYINYNVLELN
jgi:hypothetical protein